MTKLVTYARPSIDGADPHIVVQQDDHFEKIPLKQGATIRIRPDKTTRYCTGWQDIKTHTSHPCETNSVVDDKFENCFQCRQKTGFNPAFYNSNELSSTQQFYNNTPHIVYVAYFGNGVAKAGITSKSRGLARLYEQGALLYSIIEEFPNADQAHELEDLLISRGVRNSVQKKQKSDILTSPFRIDHEKTKFQEILKTLEHPEAEIVSTIDEFFFGEYPAKPIESFGDHTVSGKIIGVAGRYLVLENNELLYGYWLTDLFGYPSEIDEDVDLIDHAPVQASLF